MFILYLCNPRGDFKIYFDILVSSMSMSTSMSMFLFSAILNSPMILIACLHYFTLSISTKSNIVALKSSWQSSPQTGYKTITTLSKCEMITVIECVLIHLLLVYTQECARLLSQFFHFTSLITRIVRLFFIK